jgi:hypothetical protein
MGLKHQSSAVPTRILFRLGTQEVAEVVIESVCLSVRNERHRRWFLRSTVPCTGFFLARKIHYS